MCQVKYSNENENEIGYLYNFANLDLNSTKRFSLSEIEIIQSIISDCSDLSISFCENENIKDEDIAYWLLYVIARCEQIISKLEQEAVNDMKRHLKHIISFNGGEIR